MLHLIFRSPFNNAGLESCVRTAQKGDPVLLIEDGVIGAMAGSKAAAIIQGAQKDHEFYALRADVKARGVDRVADGIKVVDYAGMVDLVEKHRTMSWL